MSHQARPRSQVSFKTAATVVLTALAIAAVVYVLTWNSTPAGTCGHAEGPVATNVRNRRRKDPARSFIAASRRR